MENSICLPDTPGLKFGHAISLLHYQAVPLRWTKHGTSRRVWTLPYRTCETLWPTSRRKASLNRLKIPMYCCGWFGRCNNTARKTKRPLSRNTVHSSLKSSIISSPEDILILFIIRKTDWFPPTGVRWPLAG